jgi:hypothetical protein
MAEREGFEPSVPLLAVHTISSRAPSTGSDISPQLISLLKIRFKTPFFDELYLSNSKPGKNIHCIFCSLEQPPFIMFLQGVSAGGEGGIRTHDPAIHRIPLFESGAFSRSATSPALSLWDTSDFIYMNYNLMSRF